jgi:TldD protein
MLDIDLDRYKGLLRGYAELRAQENSGATVSLVDGNAVRNQRSATGGVSARCHRDGVWGFASYPSYDAAFIERAAAAAAANAEFLAAKAGRGGGKLPARPDAGRHFPFRPAPLVSQSAILDYAKALDARIAAAYPDLASRNVVVSLLDMEKRLVTSDGAAAASLLPRAVVYVGLTEGTGEDAVDALQVFGGLGRFEDLFGDPERLMAEVDELRVHLGQKAKGVYAKPGVHDVILGPDLAGILAHEAVGHTVEADLVLGGSVAADNMDKRVASELVTMVDFAHTAFGKPCPIPLHVDDEGTAARDAVLIDKGVLRSYMHNKESAEHFGVAPDGNARAFLFSDEPLIRMRNTAILPGTSKLADMIAGVDDGYYLIQPNNGQADSTGEFMFGVTLGYEIKGGKLGRAIKDATISGVAFDMLKTVVQLSDDMVWSAGGFCGKKQPMTVGMGGPAIRCRVSIGGR